MLIIVHGKMIILGLKKTKTWGMLIEVYAEVVFVLVIVVYHKWNFMLLKLVILQKRSYYLERVGNVFSFQLKKKESLFQSLTLFISLLNNSFSSQRQFRSWTVSIQTIHFQTQTMVLKNLEQCFLIQKSRKFKVDKTTTSQVNQYDWYVQFWSAALKQIINWYCGSWLGTVLVKSC